jgi:hypothetical protein
MNSEASTGPCVRDTVEEPHTSGSHVECEAVCTPVRMGCFPFQHSPFVTIHHGSSGRRSRLKSNERLFYCGYTDLTNMVSKVDDNTPAGTSASSSHALDESYTTATG